MTFRPATPDDTLLTHRWRTQAEQQAWYGGQDTQLEQHRSWLRERIDNPLVHILIWEQNGDAKAVVRIDSDGSLTYHADRDADDEAMLRAAIAEYAPAHGGRLKATVDAANPQAKALARAGFSEYPAVALVAKPDDSSAEPEPVVAEKSEEPIDTTEPTMKKPGR